MRRGYHILRPTGSNIVDNEVHIHFFDLPFEFGGSLYATSKPYFETQCFDIVNIEEGTGAFDTLFAVDFPFVNNILAYFVKMFQS